MDFKKIISVLFFAFLGFVAFGQKARIKKQKIMVVPGDRWMTSRNFYETIDTDDGEEKKFHYKKAFESDPDLTSVVEKIGAIFLEKSNGRYGLTSMQQLLKRKKGNRARKQKSSKSFNYLTKADIIIYLDWQIEHGRRGNKVSTITLSAKDPVGSFDIAIGEGEGDWVTSGATVKDLLAEAIIDKINPLLSQFQNYFEDMKTNGRKISFEVYMDENSNKKFEDEVGDITLQEVIEDWITTNSANGNQSPDVSADSDEVTLKIDEARIPLFNEKGRAITGVQYLRKLVKFLKSKGFKCRREGFSAGEQAIRIF